MHISKEVYCLFAKGVCVHSEEMMFLREGILHIAKYTCKIK